MMRIFLTALTTLLTFGAIANNETLPTLEVRVLGIHELSGELRLSLYNSSENWLEKSVKSVKVPVKSNVVTWNITGLPPGQYAIAGFHDVNLNGECDRNFIGIPTEGFGFSNNIRPVFSAPEWEKTKFDFTFSHKALEITLQ
jgi:uncharacterized protein (DUF2141 family)